MTDLGLYVHIPFCLRRCGYCDFCTFEMAKVKDIASPAQYIEALRTELDFHRKMMGFALSPKPAFGEKQSETNSLDPAISPAISPSISTAETQDDFKPTSIFFGGGTPSMLTIEELESVLSFIDLSASAETSIEANPETLNDTYIYELQRIGFDRLSMGMQSSNPRILKILGRQHTNEQVASAVSYAKKIGLNVSIDLIYGSPSETLGEWIQSVTDAIALEPDHISCYALTLEPSVPLYSRRSEIDSDIQSEMYYAADELLEAAGFANYEISNWAKPGRESKHNLNYWHQGNWVAIGASAASALGNERITNTRDLAKYMADPTKPEYIELLSVQELENERIMLGLRLPAGLTISGKSVKIPRHKRMIADSIIRNYIST